MGGEDTRAAGLLLERRPHIRRQSVARGRLGIDQYVADEVRGTSAQVLDLWRKREWDHRRSSGSI
jgi:hypothetical protein